MMTFRFERELLRDFFAVARPVAQKRRPVAA
jgi:hypothetical protein